MLSDNFDGTFEHNKNNFKEGSSKINMIKTFFDSCFRDLLNVFMRIIVGGMLGE